MNSKICFCINVVIYYYVNNIHFSLRIHLFEYNYNFLILFTFLIVSEMKRRNAKTDEDERSKEYVISLDYDFGIQLSYIQSGSE